MGRKEWEERFKKVIEPSSSHHFNCYLFSFLESLGPELKGTTRQVIPDSKLSHAIFTCLSPRLQHHAWVFLF